jgi:TRAP-type C4-dicarboxylate transport system permease small subunit
MFLLPERIIEIVIILFSHRFNLKIIDLESATAKRKEYIIQIVVYIISICTLLILSYTMVKVIINENNSITDSTNQVLLRINIYMALFVTFVLTIAMRSITEHYKKKNTLNNNEIIQSLDYIKGLIDDKDFIKAKNSIDG